jgi:hypothetical protein
VDVIPGLLSFILDAPSPPPIHIQENDGLLKLAPDLISPHLWHLVNKRRKEICSSKVQSMIVYLAIQSRSRIPSQRTSFSSTAVVCSPFSSRHLKEDDNNIHHFSLLSRYHVTSKFAVDSGLGRSAQIRSNAKANLFTVWSRKFIYAYVHHTISTRQCIVSMKNFVNK